MDKSFENVFNRIFGTILRVNISTDKMNIFKTSPRISEVIDEDKPYSKNLDRFIQVVVTDDYKEEVRTVFDCDNMRKAYIDGEECIDCAFEYERKGVRVEVNAKLVPEDEDNFTIIFFNIADAKKKFRKDSENLIKKLGIIYDEVGIIDVEEWKMIKYKQNVDDNNVPFNEAINVDELLGYYIDKFIHEDDKQRIRRRFSKDNLIAELSVSPYTIYEEIRKKVDGQYQNYILSASRITSDSAKSILVTCRNINELRLQKKQMESYQRAINNAYDVILYVNAAFDTFDVVHTINSIRDDIRTFSKFREYLAEAYGDKESIDYLEYDTIDKINESLLKNELISYEIESLDIYDKNYYEVTFSRIDIPIDNKVAFLYLIKDVNERKNYELTKEKEARMMFEAIKKAYEVVFSLDLTVGSYVKLQCREINDIITQEYLDYDQFVRAVVDTVELRFADEFNNTFSRKALIKSYKEGKSEVSLRFLQMYNDGKYHWICARTVFYQNGVEDSMLAISMVSEIDEEIDDLQEKSDLEYCIKNLYGHILVCNMDKDEGKVYSKIKEIKQTIDIRNSKFVKQMLSMVHPDDLIIMGEILDFDAIRRRIMSGEVNYSTSVEVRVKSSDNQYYWNGVDVIQYVDYMTNENKVVFAVKDVNDAKLAMIQKRQYEKRFSKVICSVYSIIYESNYSTDKMVELYGVDGTLKVNNSEMSISKHLDLCEKILVHPDDRKLYHETFSYEAVMSMDILDEFQNYMIYRRILDDTNEYKWCSVWYNIKNTFNDERIVTVCVQNIDAEQKRREANLNLIAEQKADIINRETTLKLLNERSRDVYFTYEKESKLIRYCSPNAERVMGRRFNQNSSIYELYSIIGPENSQIIAQRLKVWNRKDEFITQVFPHIYEETGTTTWYKLIIYPTIHSDEDLFVAVLVDCTSDKHKQDELEGALNKAREASEAKSQFLLNMSHDMRTPLNAIIGLTEIAIQEYKDDNIRRIEDRLNKIKSSSKQLKDLISDVLNMSKIESGRMEVYCSDFSIKQFGSGIDNIMTHQANENGVKFGVEYGEIINDRVNGDKMKLEHIALNIVGNAVKFTKPGGSVVLKLSEYKTDNEEKYGLRIECVDTGIGMTKEYLQKLYKPFERENTSTVSKLEGTGLGLSITKKLVDLLGGSINVESKKNKGTKVIIDVVLDEGKDTSDASSQICNTQFNDATILVVEDKEINMEIACQLLEFMGIKTERAWNGREALELMETSKPWTYNLILMDCLMPVMDGLEATKQIRNLDSEWAKNIPIVAMTANAFEEDVKKVLEAGMNEHMAKPVSREQFNDVITKYLIRQ